MRRYALEVTGTSTFIDGNWENSPLPMAGEGTTHRRRYPAIFANHSSRPNAQFERRPVAKPRALELRHHMVLVALETIERGVLHALLSSRPQSSLLVQRLCH